MKKMQPQWAALGFLMAVAAPAQSAGDATPPADGSSASGDKAIVLEAVNVQGSQDGADVTEKKATLGVLGELDIIEAPYTVNVVNQFLLDIQQSSRYTDYLKNIPAANVGNVAIGFFSLRGFTVGGDGYLYDGLPGHVGLSETYQLDSIDQIQVFKGPAAFLAGFGGSTSLGGTLNYVPKRATDDPVRSVELDYMNRSLFSVGGDVGERFGTGKQFGYRINARFRDGEQQAENYDWTQKTASLALDWRASENLTFAAHLEYADNHLPSLPPFLIAGTARVPKAPDASKNLALSWDEFAATGKTAYLRADWQFAKDWALTAQALTSQTKRPYEKGARSGFILNDAGDTLLFGFVERSKIDSDSAQVLVRGAFQTGWLKHSLTTGVTALSAETHGGFAPIGPEAGIPTNLYNAVDFPEPEGVPLEAAKTSESDGTSFLLSDIISFNEQWSVLLAARHASFETTNFASPDNEQPPDVSETSPTFALMFKPVPGSLLYANYSEGLEQGSTVDTGYANAGQRLAPLITEQIEVGGKLEHRGVTYVLALFELTQPSELDVPGDPDAEDPRPRRVQDGEQRHRGVEISVTGQPMPRLNLVAGTAFIDPKARGTGDEAVDGNRPVSVPRMTVNLFADYGLQSVRGLFLNAGAYHNASQYLDQANTLELESWTRFDIGARYEMPLGEKIAARFLLGIENVTDEDYWIGQSGILTIADPLTIKLSSRFDF